MQYLHSILIGGIVGVLIASHINEGNFKARLDTLETTATADWYSNATDDQERSERIESLEERLRADGELLFKHTEGIVMAEQRLLSLEALKSSAIHYGDAAVIRVVQGDTVTFGRWVEPVAKEEGAK